MKLVVIVELILCAHLIAVVLMLSFYFSLTGQMSTFDLKTSR
jgi:hypothetical protein